MEKGWESKSGTQVEVWHIQGRRRHGMGPRGFRGYPRVVPDFLMQAP